MSNKKKRTCHKVDFAIPSRPQSEKKEHEKINKNLYYARVLNNDVLGALGTMTKGWKNYKKNMILDDKSRPFRLQHC